MSGYIDEVAAVLARDHEVLREKDRQYGGSWRARGGVGAFMMLARKWDRIETHLRDRGWDVFRAALEDRRPEGILDDVADLRRYLALVEAEVICQRQTTHVEAPVPTSEQVRMRSPIVIPNGTCIHCASHSPEEACACACHPQNVCRHCGRERRHMPQYLDTAASNCPTAPVVGSTRCHLMVPPPKQAPAFTA